MYRIRDNCVAYFKTERVSAQKQFEVLFVNQAEQAHAAVEHLSVNGGLNGFEFMAMS